MTHTLVDPTAAPERPRSDRVELVALPNPFAGESSIRFSLPVSSDIRLTLHDVLGRVVRTLAEGWFPAGPHAIPWTVRNHAGLPVAPGVYLARLVTEGERGTTKIVVTD